MNQKFFVGAIFFELLSAMSLNSVSDIPTLFLILFLASAYAFRKEFSLAYRKYTFFVISFIKNCLILNLTMIILFRISFMKQIIRDLSNQEYRDFLDRPENNLRKHLVRFAYFLNVAFGGYTAD